VVKCSNKIIQKTNNQKEILKKISDHKTKMGQASIGKIDRRYDAQNIAVTTCKNEQKKQQQHILELKSENQSNIKLTLQ